MHVRTNKVYGSEFPKSWFIYAAYITAMLEYNCVHKIHDSDSH